MSNINTPNKIPMGQKIAFGLGMLANQMFPAALGIFMVVLVQDYKIRILPSSPTFLNLILMNKSYDKYDLKSLRMITYGTESMPESLLLRLKDIFPKTKLLQTFGF